MSEAITQADAYDLIDRFLRNNLYDDDYAKYSDALEAISQPAPSPQPAVPVVSDEQIRKMVESIQDPDTVSAFHNGYYTLTPDELRRAILALRPAVEPMTSDAYVGKAHAQIEHLLNDLITTQVSCNLPYYGVKTGMLTNNWVSALKRLHAEYPSPPASQPSQKWVRDGSST